MHINLADRVYIAKTVSEVNNGRVPLIVGAGCFNPKDALIFFDRTVKLRFDAYHVIPYHSILGLDRYNWFYRYLADRCPKPLFMYMSKNWSKHLPVDLIDDLSFHPNISGIKYSSRDIAELMLLAQVDRDNFRVISAGTEIFYSCMSMGIWAHTTTFASAFPEHFVRIYEYAKDGKWDAAREGQFVINDLFNSLKLRSKQQNFLGSAAEKYILKLRGLCQEYMSLGFESVGRDEKLQIEQLYRDWEQEHS